MCTVRVKFYMLNSKYFENNIFINSFMNVCTISAILKNVNLYTPPSGSFFFIRILNLKSDLPYKDYYLFLISTRLASEYQSKTKLDRSRDQNIDRYQWDKW